MRVEVPQSSDFSFKIIVRILAVLSNQDSMARTNLASKTKLNYSVLIRYITLLKFLGWIEMSPKEQKGIRISSPGKDVLYAFTRYQSDANWGTRIPFQDKSSPVCPEQSCQNTVGRHSATLNQVPGNEMTENSKSRHRIMIVDDEPDNLVTYKVFLTRAGYAVDSFVDSREALRQLMSFPPSHYDLVITDIRMPALNGLQFYNKAVEYAIRTEFLFLTALDAIEEITSAIPKIGRFQIVRKPVDETTFLDVVKVSLIRTLAKSIYAEKGK